MVHHNTAKPDNSPLQHGCLGWRVLNVVKTPGGGGLPRKCSWPVSGAARNREVVGPKHKAMEDKADCRQVCKVMGFAFAMNLKFLGCTM